MWSYISLGAGLSEQYAWHDIWLNPEPFIEAGLDPYALEGWTLADVTLNHGRGDTVPRLLKNYSFALE